MRQTREVIGVERPSGMKAISLSLLNSNRSKWQEERLN